MGAWAACDGAALRAFERQIEADSSQCLEPPPMELLPEPDMIEFAQIKARLSTSLAPEPNLIDITGIKG
jgi:hypothetical protein